MHKETKVVDAENVKRDNMFVHTKIDQEKKELVTEITSPTPLDPAILAAINAAVVSSVKAIVEHLKPTVAPAPMTLAPQLQAPYVPPYVPYNTKLQGIPVEAGQDLRHVHPSVINQWFANVEQRAKDRIKAQGNRSGLQSAMTIGRGL